MNVDVTFTPERSCIAVHPDPKKPRERSQLELATQGVRTARVNLSDKNGVTFEMDLDIDVAVKAITTTGAEIHCSLCCRPITCPTIDPTCSDYHEACKDLHDMIDALNRDPSPLDNDTVVAIKNITDKYLKRRQAIGESK